LIGALFAAFAGAIFTAAFLTVAFVTGAFAFAASAFCKRQRFFVAAMILFMPSSLIRRLGFWVPARLVLATRISRHLCPSALLSLSHTLPCSSGNLTAFSFLCGASGAAVGSMELH
jgi:hypothetical protein